MCRWPAIVALAMAMSGCGLKGDLYLPPEPPPAAAPAEGDDNVTPDDGDGEPRRQVPPTPDRSEAQ